MSYILDALRKADAERERGHVPGIHAQPMFAGAPGTAAPRAARPWKWIAAALLALLVGVLLWSLLRGRAEPAGTPAAALMPPPPAAVAMAPPAPVAVPQRSRAEPAPAAPTQGAGPVPPPAAAPVPKPTAIKPVASPKVDAKAAASGASGAAASAPGAAGEARIYALKELPDEIRRQLPALAIGGSMYSGTPADRILIINGQVLHEGDRITPDLLLEQIKLKAAVLAFRGYRVAITF